MSVSFRFSRRRLIVKKVCLEQATGPVWAHMALDTGARFSVIALRIARELGFEPDKLEPSVNVVGATGSAPAALLRLASVSLLGLEVRNLRVICHELPSRLGLQGILGINFLNRFNIEISYETETVTLARWRE